MATLGPQIVSQSYGNLLKFIDVGEDGVETGQIRISDGKGKPTPLFLSTGSAYVSGALSASAEVVFSGLTSNAPGQYVSFDTTTGRLYYSNTSSIQNVVSASYAVSAAFAPNDGDWTIGSSYMTASGQASVYIPNKLENGLRNKAQGSYSHAEGADTVANGNYSHAEGRNVSSSGTWSHAEGNETKAQQNYSHAEGDGTVSYGLGAHAEGYQTLASGTYSHAEGKDTIASGYGSHAEGTGSIAFNNYSHAEGYQTLASGTYSHAEGSLTLAKSAGSHAEGRLTTASALYAHAEGKGGVASGDISHAEGHYTVASEWHSHAEGNKTLASGIGSHAEGQNSTASGDYSHAEGAIAQATGVASHAEGFFTQATGDYSHTEGNQTIAPNVAQTVVGQHNIGVYPENDVFVAGAGLDSSFKLDGLKVRSTVAGVNPFNLSDIAGSPVIIQQSFNSVIPGNNHSGLYFGDNGVPGSHRVTSDINNASFNIERHDGPSYINLMQINSTATFVFN